MSILGKLLIVLNLLAAGAFAYLTLENYKVRHTLTTRALQRSVNLGGLPVEPAGNPADLDKDHVPFRYQADGALIESVAKKDLLGMLPSGGEPYGNSEGETIFDQTAELKRVQKKVLGTVPAMAADPRPRFAALQGYLLNLARTGAERDGINALFDQHDSSKAGTARRDLPALGRTSSQAAALRALVAVADLGDPQGITPANVQASRIGTAREAVKQFLLGEAPHGAAGAEGERKLQNALLNTFERKGPKEEITSSATADPTGFAHLAEVAAQPLTDKPSADKAIAELLAYAVGKSATPSETAALNGLVILVTPPALGFNADATIDAVATALLNQKFDDAALPAIAKGAGLPAAVAGNSPTNSAGEKARKVAHVLYHLDAHRHAARDEATVAARKAWHERVAAVVGLQEYVRAAEAQASEYAEAAHRLVAVITEEQSAFEAEYQAQVQRVQFLFTQWLTQDGAFKVQDEITKENVRLKETRETERNELQNSLKKSIEDAKESLAKLQKTQAQLFAIQKQLRDAQAALLTLEQELRTLELAPR